MMKKCLFIVSFLVIVMTGYFYLLHKAHKNEYSIYYTDYEKLLNDLESTKFELLTLQEDEKYYEECLYEAIVAYYNESDDEVFKRIFQERFPLPNEFKDDRKGGFIIIYALMEMYPNMKGEKVIDESLKGIEHTTNQINTTIQKYNYLCDNILLVKNNINTSKYIIYWNPDAVVKFDPSYIEYIVE